jgi:hypothetical protein
MIAKPRRTSNPMMTSVETGVPAGCPVTGTTTVESTVETTTVGPTTVGATVSWAVTEAEAFTGAKTANVKTESTISVSIEILFTCCTKPHTVFCGDTIVFLLT